MKVDRGLGARLSPRQTHAYRPLKRAVRVLGTRAVDRRTRIGKALDAWRADLIADLGGLDQLSKQEQAILEEAVLTKLSETEMVTTTIAFDRATYRQIRLLAVEHDTNVREIIREAVADYLKRQSGRKRP